MTPLSVVTELPLNAQLGLGAFAAMLVLLLIFQIVATAHARARAAQAQVAQMAAKLDRIWRELQMADYAGAVRTQAANRPVLRKTGKPRPGPKYRPGGAPASLKSRRRLKVRV